MKMIKLNLLLIAYGNMNTKEDQKILTDFKINCPLSIKKAKFYTTLISKMEIKT